VERLHAVAGVAMWPFTSSLGPIFSYNLLVTLALALSAWCAFLAVRRYVESPVAAALGGLLYGFSPYMVAQSQGPSPRHAGVRPATDVAGLR